MKYDFNELIQIGTREELRGGLYTDPKQSAIDFAQYIARRANARELACIKRHWDCDRPEWKSSNMPDQTKFLAIQNDSEALFAVGAYFYKAPFRAKKVFQYFQQAARLGHEEAQYWVGVFLLQGYGTKKNSNQATEYLMKSELGKKKLAVAYILGKGVPRDFNKSLDIWKEVHTPNPDREWKIMNYPSNPLANFLIVLDTGRQVSVKDLL